VSAALFLIMVVAGSMHGKVAFGLNISDVTTDGNTSSLPTLDEVSVVSAFLAFCAVRVGKAPDQCYGVAWGAASASAAILRIRPAWSSLAGGYVGLLSVMGMCRELSGAAIRSREDPRCPRQVRHSPHPTE
jgi:hypothetical protein